MLPEQRTSSGHVVNDSATDRRGVAAGYRALRQFSSGVQFSEHRPCLGYYTLHIACVTVGSGGQVIARLV